MNAHSLRNAIPPAYALMIAVGFVIGTTVGVVVIVVGGMLSGLLWSTLSRGGSAGTAPRDRGDRAAARAARRRP